MAVGIAAAECRPSPHVAIDPADVEARTLQRDDATFERLQGCGPVAPCCSMPEVFDAVSFSGAAPAMTVPAAEQIDQVPLDRPRSCP